MSDKTILITRPKGDEKSLTDMLHQHGYRVIHEPLTNIMLYHTERQALYHALMEDPDAVIVTSRHGVQALALLSDIRDPLLICVGEATARAAHSQGFTRVSIAGGSARKLVDEVLAGYDPGSRFLYVSGHHTRIAADELLNENGMQVQRMALYEAAPSLQLSDTLLEQLRRGQLDAVTFLSQRAAYIFTQLLANAQAGQAVTSLLGFCLSAAVAEPLLEQPWKGIHVTREATLASLVECVDNVFHSKGTP